MIKQIMRDFFYFVKKFRKNFSLLLPEMVDRAVSASNRQAVSGLDSYF